MTSNKGINEQILRSLQLLDPILCFLTKATGQTLVPLETLQTTIPATKQIPFSHLQTLLQYGILQVAPLDRQQELEEDFERQWGQKQTEKAASDVTFQIGFSSPDDSRKRLSGSTKTAAKRRLAALRKRLKLSSKGSNKEQNECEMETKGKKDWSLPTDEDPNHKEEPVLEVERQARSALEQLLGLATFTKTNLETLIPSTILPNQISYAGSHTEQGADFVKDINVCAWANKIQPTLLSSLLGQRQLYQHQKEAIKSALENRPTLICTGTGSGKSLCFLLPILQAAMEGKRSLVLFPTKALAQDQIVKLQLWLNEHDFQQHIIIATLDGDTPHLQRSKICEESHIILTNPDTLHAAILPQWNKLYRPLFQSLKYVVIDEAHMYEGVFGAHVAMILARLYRIASLHNYADKSDVLVFLACSATLAHPEHHFRLLCCIPKNRPVAVITKDGSPRAAKHFWVWNPPLLDTNGKSLAIVELPKSRKIPKSRKKAQQQKQVKPKLEGSLDLSLSENKPNAMTRKNIFRRRHSADETALLLALAVTKGIRCIAFCKTRGLVEWVYERTLATLKQSQDTVKYISKVESYRGGYTKMERRQIEEKLFQNELLGVVGTSALELGVDIGGVDLTLHCGFPSSHASLLQQAGRAGRGAAACERPSLAICICFNSPLDQHLWRHPTSLLTRGLSAPLSMPIYPGLVQGHLACAGLEFPICGPMNVSMIKSTNDPKVRSQKGLLSDYDLFGSKDVCREALETLLSQGSLIKEIIPVNAKDGKAVIYKTHPSIRNPWTRVSIRSMESVNYEIVDVSHPKQGGRMDKILDEAAVMDTIPYSRIFYHAFPGAIIMHRGKRYKMVSMARPPPFGRACCGTMTLGAFAQPSTHRYFTRPLSNLKITVVKQYERVDLNSNEAANAALHCSVSLEYKIPKVADASQIYSNNDSHQSCYSSFAGCGVVTVKRNVHGYKKLSLVTREEISRSELSLPDMEYDTFAFWLDCDAKVFGSTMTEQDFGHGVHALSHAILAVAPLFVPCVMSDVQCDHNIHNPKKLCIFDARAGGSGICAQLWMSIFIKKGLIEAAVELLEYCPSCNPDNGYEGGCPACIQVSECIKFNDFLCRSTGLIIAKHLLNRLKKTDIYMKNTTKVESSDSKMAPTLLRLQSSVDITSPRRKARERALRSAKDISKASQRKVVVGRPTWPMDRSDGLREENPEYS